MVHRLTVAALLLVVAAPAWASGPDRQAGRFLSVHFTHDHDGLYAVVDSATQTKDGFLWLITNTSHLQRFDGKTFYLFPTPRPTTLAAAPNGDLWLGTLEGLTLVSAPGSGTLITVAVPGRVAFRPPRRR